jgi:hypothetical protein
MLNRDAILKVQDLAKELVEVPEWGGVILVRCLTSQERDQYEESIYLDNQAGKGIFANARAKLVVRACCNEDGSRVFLDDDAEQLGRKNASAMDRLFAVAQRLSGLGSDAEKSAEKNSKGGGADGSPSA